jgi:alpha-beta hydrolase superfamily lysophospholipase
MKPFNHISTKSQDQFIDSKDGTKLFIQYWEPKITPIGVITIIHGLGEHIGRYNEWATRFTNKGYIVSGIDYRGHGKSEGIRGGGTYNEILEDLSALIEFNKTNFKGLPVILYGHSLGGNFALNYYLNNPQQISAIVVTAPWLQLVHPPTAFKQFLVSIAKSAIKNLTVPNSLNPDDLTRIPEVNKAYATDPFVHNQIAVKLFTEIEAHGTKIINSRHKFNIPILLMHGDADNITSHKSTELFIQNTTVFTQVKIWEGSYHEIHNDLDRDYVFNYTANWLENKVSEQKMTEKRKSHENIISFKDISLQ